MLTGMCFGRYDIIHRGHINFINWSKSHVDYLTVGIASDQYSSDRGIPVINSCSERMFVVSSLRSANSVFYYDSHDPYELWKLYGPTDYIFLNPELIDSDEYVEPIKKLLQEGVKILWPPRTPNVSTTNIKETLIKQKENKG